MPTFQKGSIHLFRLFGINVFLHWSWFIIAYWQVSTRMGPNSGYSSNLWPVLEYLVLFLIVLIHEFGHALACRSVGGQANRIILWPFGGVAFVDPPPRPGAMLWSIAAGPLVNVGLLPGLSVAVVLARVGHLYLSHHDLYQFLTAIWIINTSLLCFNMLPIYPMDGGQILRSLLWFWLGRARSLMVASITGLVLGGAGLIALLMWAPQETWLLLIGAFILLNCWNGLKQSRALAQFAAAPRRAGLACPKCKAAPPIGAYWGCGSCRTPFDMFATRGVCPNCGMIYNTVRCVDCGENSPLPSFDGP